MSDKLCYTHLQVLEALTEKFGEEDDLTKNTMEHYAALEKTVDEYNGTRARDIDDAVAKATVAKRKCGQCGGYELVKSIPITLHAPLDTATLTKSSTRLPGIDMPSIHWDEVHLVCKSCGWTNKPKKGWLARLFS